jgi:hypothetical protein
MRLYVDDIRKPADKYSWMTAEEKAAVNKEYIIIRTPEEAIALLQEGWEAIQEITLDHDLGCAMSGYDIAKWIEFQIEVEGRKPIPEMYCHSANPVGQMNIMAVFNKYNQRGESR